MSTSREQFDVIIAGGGPAGMSAAIHLSKSGLAVLVVEQKQFPRAKLCGEFISPECLDHFDRLGVTARMNACSGSRLSRTVFYSRRGRAVSVPSEWFGNHRAALGLSRAQMDSNLLERAKECGVTVFEDAHATRPLLEAGVVTGATVKTKTGDRDYFARLTIDATGRTRALARRVERTNGRNPTRSSLVAFKAHLINSRSDADACEIYLYKGGYGGLNAVEGDVSNLCFIVSAKDARRCESSPEVLIDRVLSQNPRAVYALRNAEAVTPWLAVKLDGFGFQSLVPAEGLLTVGDAAAFIDPFTGSGILMALQSGELVASSIIKAAQENTALSFSSLANHYRLAYRHQFKSRLRACALLRYAAFVPGLTEAAVVVAGSDRVRQFLTRATRRGTRQTTRLNPIKN